MSQPDGFSIKATVDRLVDEQAKQRESAAFSDGLEELRLERLQQSRPLAPEERAALDAVRGRRETRDAELQMWVNTARAAGRLPAAQTPSPEPSSEPKEKWGSRPVPSPPQDADAERFPNRAAYLASEMQKRSFVTPQRRRMVLTANGIEKLDGPSKHSVKKILKGESVREDVLEKLAKALTRADSSRPVTVVDIPSN